MVIAQCKEKIMRNKKTVAITATGLGSATKLAGLVTDLLQKCRNGKVTENHISWFLGLTKERRDKFFLFSLPVFGQALVSYRGEMRAIDLVELNITMLNFEKKPNFHQDIAERAKEALGLDACPHELEVAIVEENRNLLVGCLFVDEQVPPKLGNIRVYCVKNIFLMSDNKSAKKS